MMQKFVHHYNQTKIKNILGSFEYIDFPRNPETWIGLWVKQGHRPPNLQTQDLMKCKYCVNYQQSKRQIPGKLPSYRVKGVTNESCWEWFEGVCDNPNRCWGPKIRNWTVLRTKNDQWVFKTQVCIYLLLPDSKILY